MKVHQWGCGQKVTSVSPPRPQLSTPSGHLAWQCPSPSPHPSPRPPPCLPPSPWSQGDICFATPLEPSLIISIFIDLGCSAPILHLYAILIMFHITLNWICIIFYPRSHPIVLRLSRAAWWVNRGRAAAHFQVVDFFLESVEIFMRSKTNQTYISTHWSSCPATKPTCPPTNQLPFLGLEHIYTKITVTHGNGNKET